MKSFPLKSLILSVVALLSFNTALADDQINQDVAPSNIKFESVDQYDDGTVVLQKPTYKLADKIYKIGMPDYSPIHSAAAEILTDEGRGILQAICLSVGKSDAVAHELGTFFVWNRTAVFYVIRSESTFMGIKQKTKYIKSVTCQ
ncbi:hypothetical protein ACLVWU_14565 [Bdellovibrio sp. HCB290]|uniref:hypothetical protein n=1 Tax=Bdellovibrio sp. HCB290 TaxID=3394356 RepID=UPI0039B4E6FF